MNIWWDSDPEQSIGRTSRVPKIVVVTVVTVVTVNNFPGVSENGAYPWRATLGKNDDKPWDFEGVPFSDTSK